MVTLKLKLLKLFNWGKGGSFCLSVFFPFLAFSTSSTTEPVHRLVYISLAVSSSILMISPRLGNLDSGIRKILPCRIRNPWNFPWGIQFLGFGIWNTIQGIQNPTNDWNPESKFYWQRLEFSIWNLDGILHTVIPRLNWIPLHGDTQPCSS